MARAGARDGTRDGGLLFGCANIWFARGWRASFLFVQVSGLRAARMTHFAHSTIFALGTISGLVYKEMIFV